MSRWKSLQLSLWIHASMSRGRGVESWADSAYFFFEIMYDCCFQKRSCFTVFFWNTHHRQNKGREGVLTSTWTARKGFFRSCPAVFLEKSCFTIFWNTHHRQNKGRDSAYIHLDSPACTRIEQLVDITYNSFLRSRTTIFLERSRSTIFLERPCSTIFSRHVLSQE